MRSWKVILSFTMAGAMSIMPMWAAPDAPSQVPYPYQQSQAGPQQTRQGPPPGPGMVNYIEGQASIGGQALNQNSAGSATIQPGQTLTTQQGRAEVLLTPGALLRVNDNSEIRMDSNSLGNIQVTVLRGRAMVEADQVLKAEFVGIQVGPANVRLMTNGLYDFDAAMGTVRVFKGRAEVSENNKTYTVQAGHDFEVMATKLKARGFDKNKYEDAFYRWSSLRSSYLAEANADAARGFAAGYYGYPPYYAYGPNWFWDPYFDAYTWLPWDGYFFSPFGFGFYSPGFAFAAPFYGYGFGGYHHFGPGYAPPVAGYHGGVFTQRGFGGGSFAGGYHGGGFHGGGFGGGGGGRR